MFSSMKIMFSFNVFKWILGLRSPSGASTIKQYAKQHVPTPVQLLVFLADLDQMQTKQEPVDSLKFSNDTLLITVMFVSVLKPKW